jgi:perosamine synthetase
MVTTNREPLDVALRLLRQHGMSVPDTVRHASAQVVFEEYPVVGFNYRMTDIQAAIGREQLKRLPAIIARRRELAHGYSDGLRDIPHVSAPAEPDWARTNWQSYAVRLDPGVDQRAVMQRMLDEGVSTRRGVMNAHQERAYPPDTWRTTTAGLPQSERARESTIVLPLYHQLSNAEQARVLDALRRAVGR